MSASSIEVKPIAGALGAEIEGVDLSGNLDDGTFSAVRQAFLDNGVIFFRDQDMTPAQQADFARRFGPLAPYPFLQGLPEAPDVIEILKTAKDARNFGGDWHTDTIYLTIPALGTVLYAHEVPDAGGDTLFANTALAFEALSDGMKAMLETMAGINSAELTAGGGRVQYMKSQDGLKDQNTDVAADMEAEHPIVRTHPETGRKSLYLDIVHTVRFAGMTAEESKPLIQFLCGYIVQPQFTCRFRWTPGAVALWDNRCTQHFAIDDYPGQRRRMHRVTIEGDRPH
jgi:taurine dioxygenase